MIEFLVYRLTTAKFASDLSGEGSRLYGGHWNERGTPALYCASSISLALLECLVHIGDRRDLPTSYTIVTIGITGRLTKPPAASSKDQQTSAVGTVLLNNPKVLGFWVPSIIVPQEQNLILNPRSPNFASRIRIIQTEELQLDVRLRAAMRLDA